MRQAMRLIAIAVLGLAFAVPAAGQRTIVDYEIVEVVDKAKRISRHEITWHFDKEYQVGTFVNGDPWVLGPVTITKIEPGWDSGLHGTQVDPPVAREQGFRSGSAKFFPKYNEDLRAHVPLELEGTCSVVSTICMLKSKRGGAYQALETASVLTVVDEEPPPEAFRPPYIKGPKPIFTVEQIHWDRLPALEPPPGFRPPPVDMMDRLWLDHSASRGNANGTIHPQRNMNPYYFFLDVSRASAALVVDFPDRNPLLYDFMQYGIDAWHISLDNGDAWRAYGGFGNGRKWPILFTGILLDHQGMMSPMKTCLTSFARTREVDKFGEDGHTYYGQPTEVYPDGKPLWGMDGPPGQWFGNHDLRDPEGKLDSEDLPQGGSYRFVCSRGWAGEAIAARLMGAMDLWDHPAFFDYVDRWIKEEAPKGKDAYSYGPAPVKAVWLGYREKADELGKVYADRRSFTQQKAPDDASGSSDE